MAQKPKMGRHCPQFDKFIRTRDCCMTERRLSVGDEHKPYVRPKRFNDLPDSWDTQFIPRIKSWKHRARKRKQWMAHVMPVAEWKWIRGLTTWWSKKTDGVLCLSTDKDIDAEHKEMPPHIRDCWYRGYLRKREILQDEKYGVEV